MTQRHLLAPLLLALSAPLLTTAAHAGPTVATDLDLGTSTRSTLPGGSPPSPLYILGFLLRAGWRFDVAPVWFVPEIGGGYAVERFTPALAVSLPGVVLATPTPTIDLARLFVGGRIGWSTALRPELRFEPSIYGHLGAGFYNTPSGSETGYAGDVGLSLDLRIRQQLIVGAQVGYDVVTVPPTAQTGLTGGSMSGAVLPSPASVSDPWVSYGVHVGWQIW